jgi:UMF1 family MFS transporter
LGFAPDQLILLFLLIQGTGLLGAITGGRLADRFGHKGTILVQLFGWIAITIWARWVGWLGDPVREFWFLGGAAGLLLGGVQTTSRSLLARWIPPERSAEIFGFFAVAGRFASVGGPLLFGAIGWIAGGLRPAILSVSLLFVIGAILLASVNESEGERELRGRESGDV